MVVHLGPPGHCRVAHEAVEAIRRNVKRSLLERLKPGAAPWAGKDDLAAHACRFDPCMQFDAELALRGPY